MKNTVKSNVISLLSLMLCPEKIVKYIRQFRNFYLEKKDLNNSRFEGESNYQPNEYSPSSHLILKKWVYFSFFFAISVL